VIRELGPGDGAVLTAVWTAVQPDLDIGAWPADGPEAFLATPANFALAAFVDGTAAGLAWGVDIRRPSGSTMTYLHQLDVHPTYRRQGVATDLVRAAMAGAQRRGSAQFWLSTGGHNTVAQALYERLGGDRKELGDVNYWWDLGSPG